MRRSMQFLSLLLLAGCSTMGVPVSDNQTAWINVETGIPPFRSWDLYYCSANDTVRPVCYRAETRDARRDSFSYGGDKKLKEYQKTHQGALFLPNDD